MINNSFVAGRSGWKAADLLADESWVYGLDSKQVQDLAQSTVQTAGSLASELPPSLTQTMSRIKEELAHGRGVVLMRGVPTDLPELTLHHLLRTLGHALGDLLPQNPEGETCVRVADESGGDSTARGYRSNVELAFHSDSSDVLVLFCVRAAMSGGENAIVSSMDILNDLINSGSGDHLETLQRGFVYGYPDGERTCDLIPVLSVVGGQWSCRYLRAFIELGARRAGAALSEKDVEALDHFDRLALDASRHVYQAMQPGDVMFFNNHTVMHSRTAFENYPDPSQGRLLLRLWLQVSGIRHIDVRLAEQAVRFTSPSSTK